jgi:hypothetical protein
MNTSVSRVNPGRRHALTRPTPVRARSHETQGRRGKSSPLFKCQGSWRAKSTMDPWQRGRREHPRAGNPRSLLVPTSQVKLAWPRVVGQFRHSPKLPPESGRGRHVARRASEPHHADGHAPLHAAHQCVQPQGREPRRCRVPPRHVLQLRSVPHEPREPVPSDPGDGRWRQRSRLEDREDRRSSRLLIVRISP